MPISYHFPRLSSSALITLAILSTWKNAETVPTKIARNPRNLASSEPTFHMKQLELLKLFNNLNCWRDGDLKEISDMFNPLDSLDLYKDPQLVRTYFEGLKQGKGLPRDEPFVNDKNTVAELKKVFLIHFLIDDWNLFYMTAAYAMARVNAGLFYWALSTLVASKYANQNFRTPPAYEVFPQLFTPKSILYSLNGLKDAQSNLTNGDESKLDYYRHDPSVNSFHLAWHIEFPFWWRNELYKITKDKQGEMFLYMHRQLINRYRVERISVGGLEDFIPLQIGEELGPGYVSNVLNINFREFPPRLNNSKLIDLPNLTVDTIKKQADNFRKGVSVGYLITDDGTRVHLVPLGNNSSYEIIGATAEASEASPSQKIYGSLHNWLHRMIAKLPDPDGSLMLPPGVIAHSETAMNDPVFFRIHSLIDSYYTQQSRNLKPHTEADLQLPGVDLISVRLLKEEEEAFLPMTLWPFEPQPSVLETFIEDFSFDVSNGIQECRRVDSGEKFVATIKRWNHKPFKYFLKIHSHKPGNFNTTVRIFMSAVKGYGGKSFKVDEMISNMFEMDRFTVTLTKGVNVITRSSKDSAVTVPDATPTEQILRETLEAMTWGRGMPESPYGFKHDRHCGYPHHMLVPKGTREGTKFKLFTILTEGEDLHAFPGLSICGVQTGTYPDRKPMGFPFDREIDFPLTLPWFNHRNYRFTDVIVKHRD